MRCCLQERDIVSCKSREAMTDALSRLECLESKAKIFSEQLSVAREGVAL